MSCEDREDFMCAVVTVIFGVRNSVRRLQLHLVTIRKWSVNPVSNPEPHGESLMHGTISS
jgi:hypothetical protein